MNIGWWLFCDDPVPTYDALANNSKHCQASGYLFTGTKVDLIKSISPIGSWTLSANEDSLSANLSLGTAQNSLSASFFNNKSLLTKWSAARSNGALSITHLITDKEAYLDGRADFISKMLSATAKVVNPEFRADRGVPSAGSSSPRGLLLSMFPSFMSSGIFVGSLVGRVGRVLVGHEHLVAVEPSGGTRVLQRAHSLLVGYLRGRDSLVCTYASSGVVNVSATKSLGEGVTGACEVSIDAADVVQSRKTKNAFTGMVGLKAEGQGVCTRVSLGSDLSVGSATDLLVASGLSLNLSVHLSSLGSRIGLGVTVDN
jgi:hypothetical protein